MYYIHHTNLYIQKTHHHHDYYPVNLLISHPCILHSTYNLQFYPRVFYFTFFSSFLSLPPDENYLHLLFVFYIPLSFFSVVAIQQYKVCCKSCLVCCCLLVLVSCCFYRKKIYLSMVMVVVLGFLRTMVVVFCCCCCLLLSLHKPVTFSHSCHSPSIKYCCFYCFVVYMAQMNVQFYIVYKMTQSWLY